MPRLPLTDPVLVIRNYVFAEETSAIAIADPETDVTIDVLVTGAVGSGNSDAITVDVSNGRGVLIENAGTIIGGDVVDTAYGESVLIIPQSAIRIVDHNISGSDVAIINTGDIVTALGVLHQDGEVGRYRYATAVLVVADVVDVANAGTIFGNVELIGDHGATFRNIGSLEGGLTMSGRDDVVRNFGDIYGVRYGFSPEVDLGSGDDTFVNGTRGDVDMTVLAGEGDDMVFNKGELHLVDLGRGSDAYRGSGAKTAANVFGGNGLDTLIGGAANDTLSAGASRDVVSGGAGRDVISLGFGDGVADVLILREGDSRDFIEGFGEQDVIDLSDFDLRDGLDSGRLSITRSDGDTLVMIGTDGVRLHLFTSSLSADNFIF